MSSFLVVLRRAALAFFCCALILAGLSMPRAFVATQKNGFDENFTQGNTAIDDTVVMLGLTGVRWDDITEKDTPYLFDFTRHVAGANLVVKTFGETTCPARGWLTLGTGVRMNGSCELADIDADGRVAHWDSYGAASKKNHYNPRLGLLGESVKKNVGTEKVLVLGSGAGLALADSNGVVVGRYVDTARVGETDARNANRESIAHGLSKIDASTQLVVADLGQVSYGKKQAGDGLRENVNSVHAAFNSAASPLPAEAQRDLSALDTVFGQAISQIESLMPHARILVASLADSQVSRAELSFFAARGISDGDDSFLVTSDSTRTDGLIQNVDVTATLISWLCPEVDQSLTSGSPIFTSAQDDSLANTLVSDHDRARLSRGLVGIFYFFFAVLSALVVFYTWRFLRRAYKGEGRKKMRTALTAIAFAVASLPVSTLLVNLIPWWQARLPYLTLAFGVLCIVALITVVALSLARNGMSHLSLAFIGFLTAGTVGVDVVTGSVTHTRLQFPSTFGAPAQVGGRFYGMSNPAFALFAAGLLIGLTVLAIALIKRQKIAHVSLLIAAIGFVAVIVNGLAVFGADFGGPPALTLGLVLLIFIVQGKKITALRALISVVLAVCASVIFSLLDYAKPASERSHLGRFIQSVDDGNFMSVLSRKISAAVFGFPAPIALALGVAFVLFFVWGWKKYTSRSLYASFYRRDSPPATHTDSLDTIRYSLPAVLVTLISAAFINDSSLVIPFLGGCLAIVLYTAVLLYER